MSITQRFLEKDKYLLVEASGCRTPEAMEQAQRELGDYCKRNPHPSVLVDARALTGNLTTMEIFDMGARLESLGWLRSQRFAIVVSPEHADPFAETVAVNRGFILRLFTDYQEAEAWLTGSVNGQSA